MIRFEEVSFSYPDGTRAIREFSLHIQEGSFVLVCGANGSGKSTLLRLVNGLLEPTSGKVLVGGQSTKGSPLAIRAKAGFLFQDPDQQIIGETLEDDVAFGPQNLGLDREEIALRVAESLAAVGLEALRERPCHLLSGGEKRRLCLASVLAMHPSVLLLDEPLTSLDLPAGRDVLERLLALKREGRTLLLATHDVAPWMELADRMLVLEGGRLAAQGSPFEVAPELGRYRVRPPGAPYMES